MTIFRLMVVWLGIWLSACTKEPEKSQLNVGFNTWPGYEFIYLAQEKGFYAEAGVDVKLVELNALGDVRRAMERGQIDVMASTLVEVITASEHLQKPLKIIAVSDASNGADVMLSPKNKNINSVVDLAGKRLGLEGGTVDLLVSYKALQSVGLSLSDVEVVGSSQDDLVAQIEAGLLDAIQTYPPYSIKLMATGNYQVIFDTSKIPGEIVDVMSAREEIWIKRRDQVDKFLSAYFKAVDYFEKNPEESAAIMGKREGISAQEFLQVSREMSIFDRNDQSAYLKEGRLKNILDSSVRALLDTGWIKNSVSIENFLVGEENFDHPHETK